MAQLALAAMATGTVDCADEEIPLEPIADQNFNRRKVLDLQHELTRLQKISLKQHEAVSHLETGLKSMISEVDLRRALGLAFQEFENRIEDAFQDSNRKCLSMFSKREDVVELQTLITKKVNWAEYNAVLKKLADLRQYVDGMAESVFIGQREALESEFAKKANHDWVEKSLSDKAEFTDLNDVRARLERLEVLVAHNDQKQTSKLQAMREETAANSNDMFQRQSALMKEANSTMTTSKQQFQDMKNMIERHEVRLKNADTSLMDLSKAQQDMANLTSKTLLPRIEQVETSLQRKDQADIAKNEQMKQLEQRSDELKGVVDDRLEEMNRQGEQFHEQLEFLMQATEMLKRRLREMTKSQNGKMKEITDDQGKQVQQLAALERVMKKQERDTRAELRSRTGDSWHCALPILTDEDPNVRLTGVLEQLQKIAGGFSEDSTRVSSFYNPSRPIATADTTSGDWGAGLNADGGRSAMAATGGVRGMYGLSPRVPLPTSNRTVTMSKKAKRTF